MVLYFRRVPIAFVLVIRAVISVSVGRKLCSQLVPFLTRKRFPGRTVVHAVKSSQRQEWPLAPRT